MKSNKIIALFICLSALLVFGSALVSASVSMSALSSNSFNCTWQSDSDYSAHYIEKFVWKKNAAAFYEDSVEYGSASRISQFSRTVTGLNVAAGDTISCTVSFAADPSVEVREESKSMTISGAGNPPVVNPPTEGPSGEYVVVLSPQNANTSTSLFTCGIQGNTISEACREYIWYKNGATISGASSSTLSSTQAGGFAAGNRITCEIMFWCVPAALDPQSLGSDSVTINGLVPITHPAPTVSILSPLDNAAFTSGNQVSFISRVTIASGLTLSSIRWTSSRDGVLSTSQNFNTTSLSIGTHTITVTATDSSGQTGSASITVVINPVVIPPANPVVQILSPVNGANFTSGNPISFQSRTTVAAGQSLASVAWTSSRDGILSTSQNFTSSALSVGTHTITFTATDSSGRTGSASITVNVNPVIIPPGAPVVVITSPADNSSFIIGSLIQFRSTITVTPGSSVSSMRWTSSRDGILSTSQNFNWTGLSLGTHIITFAATDSAGRTGSASITVNVNPVVIPPGAPVVVITSPVNNANFSTGSIIPFQSRITVASGLSLSSVSWASSRDGVLSASQNFTYSSLSIGTHLITLTATDSSGRTGTASITVNVLAAPSAPAVSITCPADNSTFVPGTSVPFCSSVTTDPRASVVSMIWTSSRDGFLSALSGFASVLSAGWHTITLTVRDSFGLTGTASINVLVNSSAGTKPVAEANGPYEVFAGDSLAFSSAGSYDPDGTIARYTWDFGEGVPSYNANPSYVFSSPGDYIVTLTVTDNSGNQASDTAHVTVKEKSSDDDDDDFDFAKQNIFVSDIVIPQNSILNEGTSYDVDVTFKNKRPETVRNMVVTAMIPELGVFYQVGPFTIGAQKSMTRTLTLDIPKGAAKGEYDLRISVYDSEHTRIIYRPIKIQ